MDFCPAADPVSVGEMMRRLGIFAFFGVLLTLYVQLLGPVRQVMEQRPFVEKLGLIPHPQALKLLFPDFRALLGATILGRVTLYFGGLVEHFDDPRLLVKAVDYPAMSRAIHTAVKLDPYNMDAYYFGQAVLVWDVGKYRLANELLEYGMRYRNWDWQLPFFVGFNKAYFLGDLEGAAKMYMRAGELSGAAMFKTLAGRYLQEVGKTEMAIGYLETQLAGARIASVKKVLRLRLTAFKALRQIEEAVDGYRRRYGEWPLGLEDLTARGMLAEIPEDPYGGRFYLTEDHRVRTTSKFSLTLGAGKKKKVDVTPEETLRDD
ncbi:tetratricopeptide repeat protein [Geothermobacter hydrogeniphilus]|uniref:tetratricopeptide repeat protein n=1 Tax=Geothermobacter hydrogeniphilus TaxID=1969733 RepID=UPI0018EDD18B|nr:tetratricopeptide repeat protein [Geothermobacter hydrogeniphilus]